MSNNINVGVTEDLIKGYAPLNLDEFQGHGTVTNADYDIDELLGDIIMAEYVDENNQGEVLRGFIYVKEEAGTKLWRTAKVIKVGPQTPKQIQVGTFIRFPSDKGIKMIAMDKTKFIFLNAERIFCTVKPKIA